MIVNDNRDDGCHDGYACHRHHPHSDALEVVYIMVGVMMIIEGI